MRFRGNRRPVGRVTVVPIRGRVAASSAVDNFPPSKYEAKCCRSRVDSLGRFPIGFCSAECERRPKA